MAISKRSDCEHICKCKKKTYYFCRSYGYDYSDGIDYSHLKPNIRDKEDHGHEVDECTFCGENDNVTITCCKDICHECGYVYT